MDPIQNPVINQNKILIVEDDFFIRDLYEMQAKKEGYIVVTAADGEEAVAKAISELPNLVLIDLMLPKIDGLSVIKTLKADPNLSKIPCVIITNLEDFAKEQEARQAGAVGYLLKIKNTPQQVIESLKKYLQ